MSRLEDVIKRLNAEIAKIEKRSAAGLAEAGLVIRRDAQESVPVDLENLKASAYVESYNTATLEFIVEIGFTAEYAPWVHEMPGKLAGLPREHFGKTREGVEFGGGSQRGYYWDPQGKAEPQFLRKALLRNEKKILELIRK